MSVGITVAIIAILGLNPCCNGIYSMRLLLEFFVMKLLVLILVVMEYTQ